MSQFRVKHKVKIPGLLQPPAVFRIHGASPSDGRLAIFVCVEGSRGTTAGGQEIDSYGVILHLWCRRS